MIGKVDMFSIFRQKKLNYGSYNTVVLSHKLDQRKEPVER